MDDYNVTRDAAGKVTDRFSKMLRDLRDDVEEEIVVKEGNRMSDYRIDAATKEEWAYRALNAEDKVSMLVDNLIALKSYLKKNDDPYYVAAYIDAAIQEVKE